MDHKDFKKYKHRLLILGWTGAVLVALLAGIASVPLVRFASRPEAFRQWLEAQGLWGYAAYVGMVILQIIVALIPGEPFEIAAGYAFGAWEGTLIYLAAAAAGSMGVFTMVRRFGRPLVEMVFPKEKLHLLRFLKTNPKREILFLMIFMLPGTPKDLLCYFAGLTDMRLGVWLLICSLGRIPSVITSTIGGDALGTSRYGFAAIVFLLTLAISLGGLLIFRKMTQKEE